MYSLERQLKDNERMLKVLKKALALGHTLDIPTTLLDSVKKSIDSVIEENQELQNDIDFFNGVD